MKVIITESQYNKAIDLFISHLLEPHEVKTNEDYPKSIFWVKDGEVIVEIRKPKYFFLKDDIWYRLYHMFDIEFDEIQSFLKIWLERNYDLGELTPRYIYLGMPRVLE